MQRPGNFCRNPWTCRCSLLPALALAGGLALAGCASQARPQPQTVVVRTERCPRPAPPALPPTRGLFLESREGYAVLKSRDARIRAYIAALNAALDCYEAQTTGAKQ